MEPDRPSGVTLAELVAARSLADSELARGRSNPQIATELGVSRKTVGSHIEHIYTKLGVSTRTEAALFAMRHGLLPQPPT